MRSKQGGRLPFHPSANRSAAVVAGAATLLHCDLTCAVNLNIDAGFLHEHWVQYQQVLLLDWTQQTMRVTCGSHEHDVVGGQALGKHPASNAILVPTPMHKNVIVANTCSDMQQAQAQACWKCRKSRSQDPDELKPVRLKIHIDGLLRKRHAQACHEAIARCAAAQAMTRCRCCEIHCLPKKHSQHQTPLLTLPLQTQNHDVISLVKVMSTPPTCSTYLCL